MSNVASCMPTSFVEARAMLAGRVQKKIANNTWLRDCSIPGVNAVSIQHHDTHIVTFTDDGAVQVDAQGYRSSTTKSRINGALRGTGARIVQRDFEWVTYYAGSRVPCLFFDGITFSLEGR